MTPEQFDDRWAAFVARWAATGPDTAAGAALVDEVLANGLPDEVRPEQEPDDDTRLQCEIAVVTASGQFDAEGYVAAFRAQEDHLPSTRAMNRLKRGDLDPVEHFCQSGWRWLRSPRADFDVWWYWQEHLDPTASEVNPFLHHLLAGRADALPTAQPRQPVRPAVAPGDTPRRACLFAAFDADGIVDDYVVAYLRELSRHADVYYLADGVLVEEELAKLADVTAGAWARPHGRYDFGSYALLATELVGWEALEAYDEVLLANDSCYLLRPLDEVFDRMDREPVDWWGLQATKRDYTPADPHDRLPLDEAKRLETGREPWNPNFRLHISSYFVGLRRAVLSDPGFRQRLSSVARQPDKGMVILKYEIGVSDYLVRAGFDFATYVEGLRAYHPLYNAEFFDLVGEGFPLLKRNLIGANPRRAPDLHLWKERILAAVPDAPIEMFERNLLRVSADDALQQSLRIRTRDDGTVDLAAPLTRKEFRDEDRDAPKFDHWWAFPVCAYQHTFAGNERAVFDEVKDDPSIKKIVLTRSRRVDVSGENVVVVPIGSREGQHYLARARQIFVKHGPLVNVPWPISMSEHNVINLWHGIPLKRFGMAMTSISERQREFLERNHVGSRVVITSSKVDSLAMASAFYPVPYADLWPTGLPRNDYIRRADDALPADLREAALRLRAEVGGRRLVMFLPTFKDDQEKGYFEFSPAQVEQLREWAGANNAVIGLREHMADRASTYARLLAPLRPIDLSARRYPDLEVLYREADALVSDYSSCLVDFQLTGRPVISFAYDLEHYAGRERGLFYDLDEVLPGPVCRTFDDLLGALHDVFRERTPAEVEDYAWRRRFFFDHVDDGASRRVVRKVKGLYVDAPSLTS